MALAVASSGRCQRRADLVRMVRVIIHDGNTAQLTLVLKAAMGSREMAQSFRQ